ncbi:hypothetical protein L218DRAFT_958043 [Marasmius fiardii PR-910]|nr:hypothetical protein L218DRAFT_958043 [Marasmius fiardii PR-910]
MPVLEVLQSTINELRWSWILCSGAAILSMISVLFVARRAVERWFRRTSVNLENSKVSPRKHANTKQAFDAFLVLDVEATCDEGSGFDYPNEIIEIPVALMTWKSCGEVRQLVVQAEFHTFVKPSWRPVLSSFCTNLTGITQKEIDIAPDFPQALLSLKSFLADHGLIELATGERKMKFCWCTDGPFDIRDFMVKQSFISQHSLPSWMRGNVLDVREMVWNWCSQGTSQLRKRRKKTSTASRNIVAQLRALELPEFEGRQHSGRDDTRNLSRILAELARRGMRLQPNTTINFNRQWQWMGRDGQVLYDPGVRQL